MPPASPAIAVPPRVQPPHLVLVQPLSRPQTIASPERVSEAERTLRELPGPDPRMIAAIAVHIFEALEGSRGLAQLGNAVTWKLAVHLGQVRAARQERRHLFKDERHSAPRPKRVVLCRPTPHAVEASVVLETNRRTHAVALRFEWVTDRWRATEATVL
ncbi:Rv3235 family protein [Leucobacter sp. W1153]|uniref:Rv3235 family protein n=1 Tax=unclassified Leucobacter TaxID=2621730 RepID=UPI003F2F39EF